jgi:hypothetical protein
MRIQLRGGEDRAKLSAIYMVAVSHGVMPLEYGVAMQQHLKRISRARNIIETRP